MRSSFPGMDPYIEDPAFWPDFHAHFITFWCDHLADHLPEPYEARIGESVNLIQMSPGVVKLIYPDVAVSRGRQGPVAGGRGASALLEPVTIPHEILEEVRQTRVEILHRPDRSLVTVLEMLSPANKTGDGFHEYRSKRKAILLHNVHLVELDLLVGGNRLPHLQPLPKGDYFAFISRADNRPNCEVYSWTVRQPLPPIPIPLRAPDPDVILDLQTVFELTFERGRYARSLPYDQPPAAPLSDEDKKWAAEIAANSGTA